MTPRPTTLRCLACGEDVPADPPPTIRFDECKDGSHVWFATARADAIVMRGVREHYHRMIVELGRDSVSWDSRAVFRAYADDGYCYVEIDALDLIAWVRANRPEMLTP